MLSRQGEYLRHFGGEGSLDHQLSFPAGLSINSDGNIIVADRGNKLSNGPDKKERTKTQ